jgi:hypothetical protein
MSDHQEHFEALCGSASGDAQALAELRIFGVPE